MPHPRIAITFKHHILARKQAAAQQTDRACGKSPDCAQLRAFACAAAAALW
jgi:hypothetical protein